MDANMRPYMGAVMMGEWTQVCVPTCRGMMLKWTQICVPTHGRGNDGGMDANMRPYMGAVMIFMITNKRNIPLD